MTAVCSKRLLLFAGAGGRGIATQPAARLRWNVGKLNRNSMPIHVDFFHPSRLVIAVVRGAITADDVRDAVQQFLASDVLHYRKIVDIASPTSPLDNAAVELMANLVLSQQVSRPRGALAFVVNPGQAADNAETFARLTSAERPVKVFQSLHAARKWLDEQPMP
jgi:hypothetical protein